MEMSQGNSFYSYLKKLSLFSFTKLESRRTEQVLSVCLVPVEGRRGVEGCRRVNVLEILCTRVCKQKKLFHK
jgi:hypothetical protein